MTPVRRSPPTPWPGFLRVIEGGSELGGQAWCLRQIARDFPLDPAGDRLRETADELEAQADALEKSQRA